MEDGSKRKKANIFENLKKINLDSTSSSLPKKLVLRNEFSSIVKFSEKTNSKNILNFPLCLSLFTSNKTINDIDSRIKEKQKNKLTLNLKSLKPQKLTNLNLNEIVKTNNKKIISRNTNKFNSLSPINSKKFISFTRFSTPVNKNPRILKKLNYSPSNIITYKNPVIINSKVEQDLSIIKKIKKLTMNNLNYNLSEKKIIGSLLVSPSNPGMILQKKEAHKARYKKKINKIKKMVQNDIYNFEYRINKELNIKKEKESKDNIKTTNLNDNNNYIQYNPEVIQNEIKKDENINNINNKNIFKLPDESINNKSITVYKNSNNIQNNLKELFNGTIYDRYTNKYFTYTKRIELNNINNNKLEKNTSDKDNNFEKNKLYHNEFNNIIIKNKTENKKNNKENKINQNVNENKSKMERLTRLKSCFSPETKSKNKLFLNGVKEKDIKNNNNKNKNKLSPEKKRITDNLLNNNENNSTKYLLDDLDNNMGLRRTQSAKNINLSIKLKNNKFYLSIVKKKVNNKYNHNKFLKKWNGRLNEISSNNRINRKIYVKKTIMLLNTQEKVNNFLYNEKNKLKIPPQDTHGLKSLVYYNDIAKGKKINKKNENIMKRYELHNYYKCNLALRNFIITSIEFQGFLNIIPVKHKKDMSFKKSKKNLSFNGQNSEVFVISKTKDEYKNINWMHSHINLLSIQEVILRSNEYYYNRNKAKRHTTIKKTLRKNFSFSQTRNENNSVKKKYSLNLSLFKKNLIKKTGFNDYSLLNQKKFFRRPRKGKKLILDYNINDKLSKIDIKNKEKEEALSDFSSEGLLSHYMDNSERMGSDDTYLNLLSYMVEGRNKQFIKLYFQKKKFIDINQKLIEGNTLLILGAREGNFILCKFLCEQGIEVNLQNDMGNTALHYAIGSQFYSIADILTRFGAREDIPNNKGLLPWDCIDNHLD